MGEYDATGVVIRQYGYVPDSTWTTDPLYQKQGAEYAYYQNDHLGTPQRLVKASGETVWSGRYRAFGEVIAEEGGWVNPLRFPGQYEDLETGTFYNYFRDYEAGVGRYSKSDPIGLSGGLNEYGYVNGNPVTQFDPKGLYWAPCPADPGRNCWFETSNSKDCIDEEPSCVWPVTITWTHGLPGARIKPSETKTYSGRCLLTAGLIKGGISRGVDAGINAAKRKAIAAGRSAVASVLGAATGPAGVAYFGSITVSEVFAVCECEN